MKRKNRSASVAGAVLLLVWAAAGGYGCGPRNTLLVISSFKDAASPQRYHQRFREGYFDKTAQGNYEIVLRCSRASKSTPTQPIEQAVHIRMFWKPEPGVTWADDTGFNATVRYYVLQGGAGVCYEGGGYVEVRPSWDGKRLRGRFGVVELKPGRSFGPYKEPFGPIELSGHFVAERDAAQVSEITRQMMQQFGPLPRSDAEKIPPAVR